MSFGIHEYIDIPDINYDPAIGMLGFQVSVTLSRPGFRVKFRKKHPKKIGKDHRIRKEDAISYFEEQLKVKVNK